VKRLQRDPRRARRGQTVVEATIAGLLIAMLFGAIALTTTRGSGAARQTISKATVDVEAQRLLGRIAGELLDADRGDFPSQFSDPGGNAIARSSIDYHRIAGFAGGAPTFGPTRRLELRNEDGDPDDGLDNDSDGLVDECRLVLVQDVDSAPGVAVELGTGVREYLEGETGAPGDQNGNGLTNERGLCLTYDAPTSTLTLRLTIERQGSDGRRALRTAQTSVYVRNQR
jgi:hypothetical protein